MRPAPIGILIFAVAFLLTSCPKNPLCPPLRHELRISFHSQGFDSLHTILYPKSEYLEAGGSLYRAGDFGGGFRHTEFTLTPGHASQGRTLYYTDDTSTSPTDLLSRVFDSILIGYRVNSTDTFMFFSPGGFFNYRANPFTMDTAWSSEIYNTQYPDNFCENPVHVRDYSFTFE